VGTTRGIEARVVPDLGYPIEFIDVAGLKGKGLFGLVRGMMRLPLALYQSLSIVRRFQPDVAIGVGGYASGPVLMAAWLLRMPIAVLEQNTVPGVTNRILARFANQVYVMFESSKSYFPPKKVVALGNPIRRQLLDNFLQSKIPTNDRFNILVLGGSQGAHALNLRMVEAAGNLKPQQDKIRIVHQTGAADEALVKKGYADLGFDAQVSAFIDDMSGAYKRADLVVCRAGATTLAEVMVAKKASILIPYPYAADNHQELNARSMVEAGASLMLLEKGLDGRRLADEISGLIGNVERVSKMEQAASRTGRPEAAREIVDACVELIERRKR
jgi:UDP-N-acetylglucosamine--N-acetylmuramyl-(pentapeptide) pyrophosphoryl-undecaprenol N-acetylglucosamine transferase